MKTERRKLLLALAAVGGFATIPFLIRNAIAMGIRDNRQGFQKLQGVVLLNGKPATLDKVVAPGDSVSTGVDSLAIFVVDQDVYLLRGNSRLAISGEGAVIKTLNLLAGKMLSVFGKGEKKIILPTATVGIRGTAIYAEAEPLRSYLCTCYGTVNIQANSNPSVQEKVVTKRHDAPRYIYASGEQLIVKAPVINHTDDELFMLEAIVGRMPEFYGPGYDSSSGY